MRRCHLTPVFCAACGAAMACTAPSHGSSLATAGSGCSPGGPAPGEPAAGGPDPCAPTGPPPPSTATAVARATTRYSPRQRIVLPSPRDYCSLWSRLPPGTKALPRDATDLVAENPTGLTQTAF